MRAVTRVKNICMYQGRGDRELNAVERSPTAYLVATCRRQLCRHSVTHVYLFATHIMYI